MGADMQKSSLIVIGWVCVAISYSASAGQPLKDLVCTAKDSGRSFVIELEENDTLKALGPGNQLARFKAPTLLRDPLSDHWTLHGSTSIELPPEDKLAIWTLSLWGEPLSYRFDVISPPMEITYHETSKYVEVGVCIVD